MRLKRLLDCIVDERTLSIQRKCLLGDIINVISTSSAKLIAVSAKAMIDIIIVSVVFIAFFVYSLIKNKLPKYLGYIMIVMYIIYLTYIILRDFVLA